jgi:hypothetical protein
MIRQVSFSSGRIIDASERSAIRDSFLPERKRNGTDGGVRSFV